jgi:hypothetical protein
VGKGDRLTLVSATIDVLDNFGKFLQVASSSLASSAIPSGSLCLLLDPLWCFNTCERALNFYDCNFENMVKKSHSCFSIAVLSAILICSRKIKKTNMQSFNDYKLGWSKEPQWDNNCSSFLSCFFISDCKKPRVVSLNPSH